MKTFLIRYWMSLNLASEGESAKMVYRDDVALVYAKSYELAVKKLTEKFEDGVFEAKVLKTADLTIL